MTSSLFDLMRRQSQKFATQEQTLCIDRMLRYCENIADLSNFVTNVQLSTQGPDMILIVRLINEKPLECIPPLHKLALRYIKQVNIKIDFHQTLLSHLIANKYYDLALELVEAQAMPYRMKYIYHQFLFDCFIVLVYNGKYKEAHAMMERLMGYLEGKKIGVNVEKAIEYVMAYVFVILGTGNRFSHSVQDEIQKVFNFSTQKSIEVSINQTLSKFYNQFLQNLINFAYERSHDFSIIKKIIQKSQLLTKLHSRIIRVNSTLLGSARSFIADKKQRLRLTQLKSLLLSEPATMRKINIGQNLARYDCKDRILYFRLEEGEQQELNEKITKCYEFAQAIKMSRYFVLEMERERERERDREEDFGGIGFGMPFFKRSSHQRRF